MADPIITRGAQLAAAARTLGMSLPELEAYVAKKSMRAGVPEEAAMAQLLQKMAAVAELEEEMPAQIGNTREIPESQVEYGEFGNQDELQNFGGVDERGLIKNVDQARREVDRARGKRDPNEIVRYYYDKSKKRPAQETFYAGEGQPIPERFQDVAKNRDFGIYEKRGGEDQGQYVVRDGKRLFRQYGQEVTEPENIRQPRYLEGPGNAALVAPAQQVLRGELARLQAGVDQYGADAFPGIADAIGRIEDDLQANRGAESSLAAELVRRDNRNVNQQVVQSNDRRADLEAQGLLREGYPGPRVFDDIGDIQQIGHAKVASDFNVAMPIPGRQVEPTSLPVGLATDLNAPVTDNRFAGPLQRQEQWLVDHAPGYREGQMFGDFPQIAIDQQLNGVQEALAKIKIGNQGLDPSVTQIRSLADLQRAADAVNALAGSRGFNIREGGENIHVANAGIHEVLRKARFNENQENDLARALYAVEALNPGGARGVAARDAFMRGESVRGQGEMGGRRLVAIQGEGGKEYRVVREPNKQPVGGAQHQLLGGGQIPVGRIGREKIEGREVKGELQKLQGRQADPPLDFQELRGARMPDQAVRGGEKAPRAQFIRGEDAQLSTAALIAKHGKARGELAAGVRRRAVEDDARRQAAAPPRNVMGRIQAATPNKGIGRVVPGLDYETRILEPDPWTQPMGTGRGVNQTPSAPTASRPQLALPYRAGDNPFGVQGPEEGNLGRRTYSSLKNFAKSPQHKRGRRIAYGAGALTGLAALIGGERDRREEEAYQ